MDFCLSTFVCLSFCSSVMPYVLTVNVSDAAAAADRDDDDVDDSKSKISVFSFFFLKCSFDFRCIEHMQLSVFVRSQ